MNQGAVERLSRSKGEPGWMTAIRLRTLRLFEKIPADELSAVDNLDVDVPETGEDQGPAGERSSEVIDQTNRDLFAEQGILFCDMNTAVREYPHLVKEYFGTIVPHDDSKFVALNTSMWSGGTFVYVPPGVKAEMPLQVELQTNAESGSQFERTLIIADEGAQLHYIEGCSAPVYTKGSQRSAVSEIVVRPNARVTYTTLQNWSSNVNNLVTKRARVEAGGHMAWTDGDIGSKLTVKQPEIYLVGDGATGEVLSVASAGKGQHQNVGAKVVHAAPNTTSRIISKSIGEGGGVVKYRAHVRVDQGAVGANCHVECDALLLDDRSVSTAVPVTDVAEPDAQISRGGTVSKITGDQLYYLLSRGLSEEQAVGLIVNGFVEPIISTLPIEYAVEWSRLIELHMEGSVG